MNFNTRIKKNINVQVLVWLFRTKICWKSEIVLYGYTLYIKIIVYIKADNVYKDIAENIETRFDTSNYWLDRPIPKIKNKKVIGLMKHK